MGGAFTTVNATTRNYLAALDSSATLTAWNPNPDSGDINDLETDGTNIYVTGSFSNIGGQPRNYIASVSNTDGSAQSFNPLVSGDVYDMTIDGDLVYIGGAFNSVGSSSRRNIAAVNKTTGAVSSWSPPKLNSSVYAIDQNGSYVLVSGDFTTVGSEYRQYFAEFAKSDGSVSDYAPVLSSTITEFSSVGGEVYGGGYMTTVNEVYTGPFARLTPLRSVSSSVPTLSGDVFPGSTLTGTDATFNGTGTISTTRHWERCSSSGDGCVALSGATSGTYALSESNTGSTVKFCNSVTDGFTTTETCSSASKVVGPSATKKPKITFVADRKKKKNKATCKGYTYGTNGFTLVLNTKTDFEWTLFKKKADTTGTVQKSTSQTITAPKSGFLTCAAKGSVRSSEKTPSVSDRKKIPTIK